MGDRDQQKENTEQETMRFVKAFLMGLGCLALIRLLVIGFFFFESQRSVQQNFAPAAGVQASSQNAGGLLVSEAHGDSSFLVRNASPGHPRVRLTSAQSGIESEASFSHDGKLVTYSLAASPSSKSTIWVVGADGSNPHPLTNADEDALHPAFSPDDKAIFYAVSSWTGHHSPIAAPRRHEWNVYVRALNSEPSTSPQQMTNESFYEVTSLDVASDGVRPGKTKILLSTTAYPIGALFEEIIPGAPEGKKIFQPHVPDAPTIVGPSFGEARFTDGGMTIIFLAAIEPPKGGNYDYNVYSMSDVTGGELKQITHLSGMTTELHILSPDQVSFVNAGAVHTATVTPAAK